MSTGCFELTTRPSYFSPHVQVYHYTLNFKAKSNTSRSLKNLGEVPTSSRISNRTIGCPSLTHTKTIPKPQRKRVGPAHTRPAPPTQLVPKQRGHLPGGTHCLPQDDSDGDSVPTPVKRRWVSQEAPSWVCQRRAARWSADGDSA